MVGRLLAPAVVFEASPRYSRAEAPGCAQTCPAPFYAAFQAPGVASGGARGRALRALKQKTGPPGLRFPPLRGGASVLDRKSVVQGTGVAVRVGPGGRRVINTKNTTPITTRIQTK